MARIVFSVKKEHLDFLKLQITNKFKKEIKSTKDCELLSFELKNTISIDTLRRLFKLIKGHTEPTISTLDLCSIYCGYVNFDAFIVSYNKNNSNKLKSVLIQCLSNNISSKTLIENIENQEINSGLFDIYIQIILIKVMQKDESFFELLFSCETLFLDDNKFRYEIFYLIQLLSTLCKENKWLQKIAAENYYDFPKKYGYSADFFVEWLVTPHETYYRQLLSNYYNTDKQNSNKKAFFHLIMATYYADCVNWEDFTKHYKEICSIDFNKIETPILLARKLGVDLLYANQFEKANLNIILSEKISIFKENLKFLHKDTGDKITYVLFLSEYLYKINQCDKIIDLVENCILNERFNLTHLGNLNWNQLQILYCGSLHRLNKTENAKLIFKTIKEDCFDLNFNFLYNEIYNELKTCFVV